ncbi:MAG: hypothetical protein LBQ28_06790 [Prevotellaceae bacterium]|jgi:hypothetical protein|nr:hypothetical protein [Prevotellaceae bacterium]
MEEIKNKRCSYKKMKTQLAVTLINIKTQKTFAVSKVFYTFAPHNQ